ncbi:Arylsulfotransferase (ASST) [Arthrobacter sp. 9AX]|uniref:aryl-sulfate sulfotransferase n=1 Tax=Arthrobacter sp. 9AX TaxID=2653131 RepID=UPI0012F38AE9|nr:aryl-sulfate sulfotransferase [Arthrobacter sp. 9AX]VXC19673.1 Arylsulfotransferase (ASST) [Arthrobacter sp. 9AX]
MTTVISGTSTHVSQNTISRRGTGLLAIDRAAISEGYTLITPIAERGDVYLIDTDGNVVHEWHLPYPPGRHARLLPNGNLFYQGKLTGDEPLFPIWEVYHGGVFLEVTPSGQIVREAHHPRHHHDATILDNGNLILLTVEPLPSDQANLVVGGTPGTEAPGGTIWADVIVEMTWEGEILWKWAAADHLAFADAPLDPHYAREHWPMANTVNQTRDGDIIVGFRSASLVIRIDRHTNNINWTLNAPVVSQQHYPHELDNGNILVFDNGSFREGVSFPYSRAIEVDPATNQVVWEYKDNPPQNFYSPYMSSASRLPNGNTLIAEGTFGRIFEVNREGTLAWEYVVPWFGSFGEGVGHDSSQGPNNSVFRAYRYSPDQVPWLS